MTYVPSKLPLIIAAALAVMSANCTQGTPSRTATAGPAKAAAPVERPDPVVAAEYMLCHSVPDLSDAVIALPAGQGALLKKLDEQAAAIKPRMERLATLVGQRHDMADTAELAVYRVGILLGTESRKKTEALEYLRKMLKKCAQVIAVRGPIEWVKVADYFTGSQSAPSDLPTKPTAVCTAAQRGSAARVMDSLLTFHGELGAILDRHVFGSGVMYTVNASWWGTVAGKSEHVIRSVASADACLEGVVRRLDFYGPGGQHIGFADPAGVITVL